MHNLLKRQLKIYFGDSLQVPTEWQKFIEAVNDAYMQSDVDRDMIERSLDLSSQELLHTNSEMRALISLLNATIESTADGILVVNKEGKIVSFNQKFIIMWHIPQQILESRNDELALSFVIDQLKDPEVFIRKVRELYANPEAESYDKLLFKDGRVVERYSKPQRIGQAIVGRVWSFRDITERKRAEERLVRSEEYFRALIENSSDVIIIVDKKGTITYTSPSIERILGYKPKELIGKSGFNFIMPADLPRAIYDFGKATITKKVKIPNLFRVRHKDGSERILEGVGRSLFDNPAVEGFVMNARDVSERKQAEVALRTSEAQLSNAMKIAKLGHWEYDVASDLFTFNDHFYAIFRTTAEEVGGYMMSSAQYAERFVHQDDISLVSAEIQKAIETDDPLYSCQIEHRIIYADGKTGYITVRFFIVKDDRGKTVKTYGANQDITERKQAEKALRASEAELHDNYFAQATINMLLSESLGNIPFEEFLQKALNMILAIPWIAFESIGSISIVEDEANVLVMKAQSNIPDPLKKLCVQVPFGKCLCGKAAQTHEVQFADHIDERHEICYEGMRSHGHYSVPILFVGRTLGVFNLYLQEGHIRDEKEEKFLHNIADTLAAIIMRKKAEGRIEYLAYYDALTGLPNSALFIDRLKQWIARAEYSKKLVSVMVINIDRFRYINDTYGLNAGDNVLKEVSKRLITSVREGDTVARLGGDDFGVLLIDIAQSEDVILIVEKIMRNNSYPIHFDGKDIVVTLGMGISVYPADGKDASILIKKAGLALLKAKQQGRKNYQFFTEDMDVKASEFVLIERNLFSALQNDEFILYYQPYWDINTKKMTGMEALVRWKSPELGLVSPARFIPVLEDTGMIIEVGEWILREAMRQVKEWQNNRYPVVPVSVNLSSIQFRQKDLLDMVKRLMADCGFFPSLLTLEITESAFMQNIEFTNSVLTALKGIGCSVSIDDFGTGYSSLAYLKRFPIDNLKIDISFIREMVIDPDSASIVMAIINMAHTLNLKTIAEGVETEEQWNFLLLLRCDMGQGFYLSKPLPAEEIEKFFK